MTYELARRLKDAGYKGYLHFNGDGTVTYDLPELIEACGRIILMPCEQGWHTGFEGYPISHLAEDRPQSCGGTPEEAVAKLWLALNERKTNSYK